MGVVDILPKCLSSKYFFYEPAYAHLSLGKVSAIEEINFVLGDAESDGVRISSTITWAITFTIAKRCDTRRNTPRARFYAPPPADGRAWTIQTCARARRRAGAASLRRRRRAASSRRLSARSIAHRRDPSRRTHRRDRVRPIRRLLSSIRSSRAARAGEFQRRTSGVVRAGGAAG